MRNTWLHMHFDIVRRSRGDNAVRAAAYRSGDRLRDPKTREIYDRHSGREDVVYSEIIAPLGAPEWVYDRQELWARAEEIERRKDSQICRLGDFGLPRLDDSEKRIDLACEFVIQEFVSRGMVGDISIHETVAEDGLLQPHTHVGLTMRRLDGDRFHRLKATDWDEWSNVERWRQAYSELANRYLSETDSDQRVVMKSFARSGIDKVPQRYIGARAMRHERAGIATSGGSYNREVQRVNQARAVAEDRGMQDIATLMQQHRERMQEREAPERNRERERER